MVNVTRKEILNCDGINSLGNQLKFKKNDKWYKGDEFGYEGLSEAVVSNILNNSNQESFVRYSTEEINIDGCVLKGCVSDNFKPSMARLITADQVIRLYYGDSFRNLNKDDDIKEKIKDFVNKLSIATKIPYATLGTYITTIVELDALVLNTDRHLNNIAFLKSDDGYSPAPIFDNGAALLSDSMYYSDDMDLEREIEKAVSKPFSDSFAEQKEACESLFGYPFAYRLKRDYIPDESVYPEELKEKINKIMIIQEYRYPELIEGSLDRLIAISQWKSEIEAHNQLNPLKQEEKTR